MAKSELFHIPILKQAIQLYGLSRGAADRSICSALKYLEAGWATGVFLQGTHTRWTDHRPQAGCSADCCEGESTTATCKFMGTEGILKKGSAMPQPAPVTVRIGEVMPLVLLSGKTCSCNATV